MELRGTLISKFRSMAENKNAIMSKPRTFKQIYIEKVKLLGHNHGSTLVFFQTFIYIVYVFAP